MNGLILAGGKSSRMGTDKGLLLYHNKPQREYLFELLQTLCNEVFTSCHPGQNIEAKWNPLPDNFNIAGPLNGILTAFQHNPTTAWLIVAVDMPFVNTQALRILINHRDPTKVATCFFNEQRKHPEPLLTLWEESAYPLLLDYIRQGKASPREFLMTHPVNFVQPPDHNTLRNFNTPEDLLNRGPLN